MRKSDLTIGDSFRKAYDLCSRNWQLVLVNMATTVLMLVLFTLLVVLPFAHIASDLSNPFQHEDLKWLADSSKIWRLLEALGLGLLWFVVSSLAGIYVYAGAAGVIKEAFQEPDWQFRLRDFFHKANRLFLPLTIFLGILLLAGIFITVTFGSFVLIVGFGSGLFEWFSEGNYTGITFLLGAVAGICLLFIAISLVFVFASITAYGTAALAFGDGSPFMALKRALRILWHSHRAFWAYALSLLIVWAVAFIFALVGFILEAIPVAGQLISLPYTVLSWSVQIFTGYWAMAVAMVFYGAKRVATTASGKPEEEPETLDDFYYFTST